ncbi:MAG TPA: hypothetical protein VOB72_01195 [Candidatus Dormibacteraeota bacterium]|nr:hypothetical protein [Candidatus Dormibacteraeota bacterium]
MLTRLLGRGPVELGKTIVLVFLALIAAVALQQLATTRAAQTAGQADRVAVIELATDFGRELTTYDYAHPDVQANRLAPLTTRQVQDKVKQAFPDLALYQAVSVGDRPEAYVQTLAGDHAQVLLQTRSTMQSQYLPPGTRTSGLLLCDVRRGPSGWRVSDYRWLTPVAEGVS